MLLTTHALTGAFIASQTVSPFLSYPIIVASHFLMDWIPHWDFGTGLKTAIQKAGNKAWQIKTKTAILGLGDLFTGLGLCFLFFQKTLPLQPILWGGVFLSLLPDFLEIPPLFLNFNPFPLKQIERLHSYVFHHSLPFPQGLIPQILILNIELDFTLAR